MSITITFSDWFFPVASIVFIFVVIATNYIDSQLNKNKP